MSYSYIVLSQQTKDALVREVNQHIAEGWTPVGGIAVANTLEKFTSMAFCSPGYSAKTCYLQAMMKNP